MRLATELASGHDATAAALDEGLLSPAHAAVIVEADRQLPPGLSDAQRQVVEAALVVKARRSTPEQLRREARRALAAIEPDQQVVDAHENDLVRTEEDLARDRCALTLHDNGRHQALALGLRHDTCAAEGCERPYAWCELHHRHPWTSG